MVCDYIWQFAFNQLQAKIECGSVVCANELSVSLCPRETLIEVFSVWFGFRAKDLGFWAICR